ncbi:hypothetical protein MKX53_17465 [Psychrobacillus sp. FSL K6-4615]|uniref:hypothetical protein n=1 Tax=Psychrobacillus sp. FSL K6-4615 TaxID=2921551 RepID=UPI0030FA2327
MAEKVLIKKGNKEIEVTEKAFRVVYSGQGYKLTEEKEDVDYFGLSREQLEKIKNDDLKAFLNKEAIEFPSDGKKDELIDLILGE